MASSFTSPPGSLLELARSVSCESARDTDDQPVCEPRSFGVAFLAVTVCGSINNLAYCVISGASQDLARQFGMQSQVTLLTTLMTASALMTTLVSTRLLIQLRFYTRVRAVFAMCMTAYLGLAVASRLEGVLGFSVALAFSCLAGCSQVVGEITNLAFLKAFPPELIGGWGAGTGIAGVLGGGVYVVLAGVLGLSSTAVFLLMTPTVLVYWAAFQYLHTEATRGAEGYRLAKVLGGTRALAWEGGSCSSREQLQPQAARTAPASWPNVKAAFRHSGVIMFSLAAVYMLEYTIYPGLDDRETLCSGKEWYSAMWMCYNIGVTLSRLSVAVFRIERVWLLTVFQLANVLGWLAEVFSGTIRSLLPHQGGLYLMAGWMVLVGLCGGATYGNCMYLFNCKEGIPDNIRELGINLGFVMSNIGIFAATLSFLLLNQTVMAKSILYPHGC